MNYEDMEIKPRVKKYEMDASKDWEDRYKGLEAHHLAETAWLFKEITRLKKIINAQVDYEVDSSSRKGYPWD